MVCLLSPALSLAQTAGQPAPGVVAGDPTPTASLFLPSKQKDSDTGYWAPFKAIPHDFSRFFSGDTLKVVALGGGGALMVHQWDGEGIEDSQEHLRRSLFKPGNIGGGFLVQAGASVGLYSVARLAGSREIAVVGADLIRAQLLSGGIVQGAKFATHRSRPDGSNYQSFPSGHTASAFATATVLQQHFGWKVGVPAYGFGAYVATARMSANKHNLSDVVFGAAIGVAAGRTVTVGSGKARFKMGVAPTVGGAAITFTKP